MALKNPQAEREIIYTDFPRQFFKNPFNNDLSLINNENSIKASLINLLLTAPGERLYQPSLGMGIRKFLFEPISPQTSFVMREKIVETIRNYEPRIEDLSVKVIANENQNSYDITVVFRIINIEQNFEFEITLNRLR